jgi:hypothetical protein
MTGNDGGWRRAVSNGDVKSPTSGKTGQKWGTRSYMHIN